MIMLFARFVCPLVGDCPVLSFSVDGMLQGTFTGNAVLSLPSPIARVHR